MNLLKHSKTPVATSLGKHIKRRCVNLFFGLQKKIKDLFSTEPKQRYNRIKKNCGETKNNSHFHLQEQSLDTANDLDKFFSSIEQSLPPISIDSPYNLNAFSFPVISPLNVETKLRVQHLSASTSIELVKAFADSLLKPLSLLLIKLPQLVKTKY